MLRKIAFRIYLQVYIYIYRKRIDCRTNMPLKVKKYENISPFRTVSVLNLSPLWKRYGNEQFLDENKIVERRTNGIVRDIIFCRPLKRRKVRDRYTGVH